MFSCDLFLFGEHIVKSYGRFSLENSDSFRYCNTWRNLELKVNMISTDESLEFLDFEFL